MGMMPMDQQAVRRSGHPEGRGPHALVVVGLDFRNARVEERERWALGEAQAQAFRRAARSLSDEHVLLRTCNRTEIVAWREGTPPDPVALSHAWGEIVGEGPPPIRILRGEAGARHLLQVSSGLASQILGDIHILGQLRRGYREAQAAGTVGPHLHRLFDTAIRAGKRVRRETDLMAAHRSVGSEAGRHLLEILPVGAPRRILVLGAGKVGSHAARALAAEPGVEVILLNRTAERAEALAKEWGGDAGGLDRLPALLPTCGGLLVATGAPGAWIDAEILETRSRDRAFPVVDLSMPRNVHPSVGRIPGLLLSDLDDVHPETAAVEKARQESIPQVDGILEEELLSFDQWIAQAQVREALRPLQAWVVEVCRREVAHVTAGDAEVADRTARRIAAKVLSRPMQALRNGPPSQNATDPALGEATSPRDLAQALSLLFRDVTASAPSSPLEPR